MADGQQRCWVCNRLVTWKQSDPKKIYSNPQKLGEVAAGIGVQVFELPE